jgi:molybdopterin molybdotransferase
MVSVQEALYLIQENVSLNEIIEIELDQSLMYTLATDIKSPINMPPFNQSAMDGYAVGSDDTDNISVINEVKAGDSSENIELKKNEAIRIFTGAMVPESAFAVVKQESVVRSRNSIEITEEIKINSNIRLKGEQIKEQDVAAKKGTKLNAGLIGFLYGLGITHVKVYKKPNITIITTGNELTTPGQPLPLGSIYESNSYTLKAALLNLGISAKILTINDDFNATKKTIKKAISNCDILITTGGISVGDYDFVGKALNELDTETIFYKVKQKPGKPLFFGKFNKTLIFGLPGNPAAALSSFYIYVTSAIYAMMGHNNKTLTINSFKLNKEYSKTVNLSHLLKGYFSNDTVEILDAQSSAMLSSFAETNCLIYLEEGREFWGKNDLVPVFVLN